MRRTKIVVTLGPATDNEKVLIKLIDAGMNVARCNFSHADYEEHLNRVKMLKKVCKKTGKKVSLLMDTKGPEIRTGHFENGKISLEASNQVTLTTEDVLGNEKLIPVTYAKLPKVVIPGTEILLDDGLINLKVIKIIDNKNVLCEIFNSGEIKDRRGVNIPNFSIDLPNPTDKDKKDIMFAIENDFDYIAVSFVQDSDTILEFKKILRKSGGEKIQVVAKIENYTGVNNFDSILSVADGIMVARGDLGVELPLEEVPIVQKEFIKKCFMAGKPVITATQLLHSMIDNPRPTRAEVSDIANAIYDLTSAVMLSGETSIGKYAVKCVETMSTVAKRAEEAIDYRNIYMHMLSNFFAGKDVTNAVTNAALTTAYEIQASAIITVTETGYTARMLSKLRPKMPIIAITTEEKVARQLQLNWGITPIVGEKYNSIDKLHYAAVKLPLEAGLIEKGDIVVIVAGVPVGITGATNLIKVETVGDVLVKGETVTGGIVTGRVCIARTKDELKLDFIKNDIVVIKHLEESFYPFLKKANGLIIEDDDIDGKAKIIGNTLDIPVIKNARAAMDILKDGTMVKLDADEAQVIKI